MLAPGLSLYVHFPWCTRKCPYCDFNSHSADALPEADYRDSLLQDLRGEAALAQGRKLESIFFGGGTPSLISASIIAELIAAADAEVGITAGAEITLEANPGSAEARRFADYRKAGVNRLSIGVQSFSNHQLRSLERIHNAEEAVAAFQSARSAGFENLNIDLMHGLPDQTPDSASRDLQQACDLSPEHISWYQLTIEPNTRYYSQPPVLPIEDDLADIQAAGESLLAGAGYHQYEVSAYAKAGKESRHNTNYWRFGDYIGIGAGAHGKLTDLETGEITRRWKLRQPDAYMRENGRGVAGQRKLTEPDIVLEYLMNALRLVHGFSAADFHSNTGLDAEMLKTRLQPFVERDLVQITDTRYSATPLGQRFLDSMLSEILADNES